MTSSAVAVTAPTKDDERGQRLVERLSFFSDAVFAIAMTLLIVEVKLPHIAQREDAAPAEALLELMPNYVGFCLSFLVLARFWVAHHHVLSLLTNVSPRLIWANLLLLLSVAFMPFPTAVMSEYIQLRVGVVFYAGWLIVVGLLNRWFVVTAFDPRLYGDHVEAEVIADHRRASWIPILLGALAMTGGLVRPLFALIALMIGSPAISWLFRRRSTQG